MPFHCNIDFYAKNHSGNWEFNTRLIENGRWKSLSSTSSQKFVRWLPPMGAILLYGLWADDADKRELADNHRDEEEITEVEGSGRVEGEGNGSGLDFDLLRTADHNDILYIYKKFIVPPYKRISLKKVNDHTMPFCHWKYNFLFERCTIFFSPHSGITYFIFDCRDVFQKAPFIKMIFFNCAL